MGCMASRANPADTDGSGQDAPGAALAAGQAGPHLPGHHHRTNRHAISRVRSVMRKGRRARCGRQAGALRRRRRDLQPGRVGGGFHACCKGGVQDDSGGKLCMSEAGQGTAAGRIHLPKASDSVESCRISFPRGGRFKVSMDSSMELSRSPTSKLLSSDAWRRGVPDQNSASDLSPVLINDLPRLSRPMPGVTGSSLASTCAREC